MRYSKLVTFICLIVCGVPFFYVRFYYALPSAIGIFAATAALRGLLPEEAMSSYRKRVVVRVTIIVALYLLEAFIVGRFSWPLAGAALVYWLILPFAVIWSWPEDKKAPLWGRTIIVSTMVAISAGFAFAFLAIHSGWQFLLFR